MAFTPHNYEDPNLRELLKKAYEQWDALNHTLFEIQERTGIPGLHTDINSNDDTAGVLERIQLMHDDHETVTLEAFKTFDEEG